MRVLKILSPHLWYPVNLWKIWMGMKHFFFEKKNSKWPTQKNWDFQEVRGTKCLWFDNKLNFLMVSSLDKFLSSPIENLLCGISSTDQKFRFVFSNMERFLSSPIENLFLGVSNIWNTIFTDGTTTNPESEESIFSTTV